MVRGEFLKSVLLVNRHKAFISFLSNSYSADSSFNGMLKLRATIMANQGGLTPDDVVDYFAAFFGVALSSIEREILTRYLNTDLGGSGPSADAWIPENDNFFQAKMAGFTTIFFSMPQANLN